MDDKKMQQTVQDRNEAIKKMAEKADLGIGEALHIGQSMKRRVEEISPAMVKALNALEDTLLQTKDNLSKTLNTLDDTITETKDTIKETKNNLNKTLNSIESSIDIAKGEIANFRWAIERFEARAGSTMDAASKLLYTLRGFFISFGLIGIGWIIWRVAVYAFSTSWIGRIFG